MVDIQDNLTNTIGLYIRDTLRTDTTLLSILNISASDAKNHIFYTAPKDQFNGFSNPRIVIYPSPSDQDKLGNTEVFQGSETFLVSLWADNLDFQTSPEAMDRISSLFNKGNYLFKDGSDRIINVGTFQTSGKVVLPDEDKTNTDKGDININLNIGGII